MQLALKSKKEAKTEVKNDFGVLGVSHEARTKKTTGNCRGRNWVGENQSAVEQLRWEKKFMGGHDLQGKVDREGCGVIWCRKCAGVFSMSAEKAGKSLSVKLLNNSVSASWFEQGKRQDRMHEDPVVGR